MKGFFKFIALICVLALLLTVSAVFLGTNQTKEDVPPVQQDPLSSSSLVYALNDDGESYMVTGIGTWKGTTLVIPEEHEDLPVTEIAPYAFSGELKSYTKAVEIPASVEVIGDGAF